MSSRKIIVRLLQIIQPYTEGHTQNVCRVSAHMLNCYEKLSMIDVQVCERVNDQPLMCAHILDNLKCRMSDTNNVL